MSDLQSIRSLAAAKKLVQSLDSSTSMKFRLQITELITEENYPWFVLAGYAQFLESQANRCYIPSEAPRWWDTGYELMAFLTASIMVSRNCDTQDLKTLSSLRNLALKFLKPILSPDPAVGLPHLAPGIRAQELESPSPPGTCHCITVAGLLIPALHQSLQYEPDPACSNLVYTPEAYIRTIAARILLHILEKSENYASALSRCLRYLSAGEIAEKCKEMLCDDSEPCDLDPTWDLHLVNMLCNPRDPGSRLDLAYAEKGLHKVIMVVAAKEMVKPLVIWGRMQHAGHLLEKIIAVNSTKATMATEYVERLGVLNMLAVILEDDFEHDWAKAGWMQIFGYVSHSTGCDNSDCLCWGRSAPFIQAVKAALERDQLWANTLIKLRALSNKIGIALPQKTRRDRMMQWLAMGLAVGLKEDDGLDGCHWKECKSHKHTVKKDNSKLLKCAGCQVALYCSKECQTKAWKDDTKWGASKWLDAYSLFCLQRECNVN